MSLKALDVEKKAKATTTATTKNEENLQGYSLLSRL